MGLLREACAIQDIGIYTRDEYWKPGIHGCRLVGDKQGNRYRGVIMPLASCALPGVSSEWRAVFEVGIVPVVHVEMGEVALRWHCDSVLLLRALIPRP